MKKTLLYMLSALMILACGCGKEVATGNAEVPDGQADGPTAVIGNPWVDCDMEEIADKYGIYMSAPAGATNVSYQMNESIGLCQMMFNYGDPELEYTQRAQKTDSFEDISGMNYEWDVEEEIPMGPFEAKTMRAISDSETVDVCLCFDEGAGMMYSLSTSAEDLDGFDITAVVMQLSFMPEPEYTGFIPANFLEDKLQKDVFESFDEVISGLDAGNAYAIVRVYGLDEDVLIISEGAYDCGNGVMAAIDGSVYRNENGRVTNIGNMFSDGTAYPISLDKDGLIYTGGHHQVTVECVSQETGAIMSKVYAYETFDENQNVTYGGFVRESNKVYDEGTEIAENDSTVLQNLFEEYENNTTAVNFTVK